MTDQTVPPTHVPYTSTSPLIFSPGHPSPDPSESSQAPPLVSDEMDIVIRDLVNFNAHIMDYCVSAAQTIVKQRGMVEAGHVTQGPDLGLTAEAHPAVVPLATALFEEIVDALKRGPRTGMPQLETPARQDE